jgi:hypothetical protein
LSANFNFRIHVGEFDGGCKPIAACAWALNQGILSECSAISRPDLF